MAALYEFAIHIYLNVLTDIYPCFLSDCSANTLFQPTFFFFRLWLILPVHLTSKAYDAALYDL